MQRHDARRSRCLRTRGLRAAGGRLVRDLVCRLIIDAQDVLITLVAPAGTEPAVDAVAYWKLVALPTGEDPLDALIPRPAAACGEPRGLEFHLDD